MVRVVWVQEKKANCPHLEMDLNLTRYLTLPLAANKKQAQFHFIYCQCETSLPERVRM